MKPLDYIHHESVRQSATVSEMAGMCVAYNFLIDAQELEYPVTENLVRQLSSKVTGNDDYRKVPAVFNQGSPAINAELIPNAMAKWFDAMRNVEKNFELDREMIDRFITEFLLIHPFADGNGRVASLLRNYLLGTLDDPTPLPYYFGGN